MFVSFAAIVLLATQLEPVVPPYHPQLRAPIGWMLAASSAGLALLLVLRPVTHRAVLLAAGWFVLLAALFQGFVVGDLIAMFGTWLVVPGLALVAGQLRPRPRKALVAAHAVAAAAWVGIGVTLVAMAVVAMATDDVSAAHAIYEMMATFDVTLLPWANFATVLTGLALSFATKWGLIRHYWVIAKAVVAVGILVMAFGFLHDELEGVVDQTAALAATGGTAAQPWGGAGVVLWGFVCAGLGLVAAMLLSLYKPGGRTRFATARPASRGRTP
ncbi:hypothetical protein [Mycobacterium sp. NAZ190054]|uniref:hypothetical protein n=1 Tax=Mycobacterium sp. NAZ190054 TaxID=1747766 RepID=UPI000A6CB23D|nr:hypothetical protein [Mycobacterium sp. NAZ190054]